MSREIQTKGHISGTNQHIISNLRPFVQKQFSIDAGYICRTSPPKATSTGVLRWWCRCARGPAAPQRCVGGAGAARPQFLPHPTLAHPPLQYPFVHQEPPDITKVSSCRNNLHCYLATLRKCLSSSLFSISFLAGYYLVFGSSSKKEGGLIKQRLSWVDIPIHEDEIKGPFLFHILTAVRLTIFSLNI